MVLDSDQKKCVHSEAHHLLVVAGPGSGKTTTIVCKCEHLIKAGTPPESLIVTTFTNKAAQELQKRLELVVGPEASSRVRCGTYHSLAIQCLRRYRYGPLGNDVTLLTSSADALRVFKRHLCAVDGTWGAYAPAVLDLFHASRLRVNPDPPAAIMRNSVTAVPSSVIQGAFDEYRTHKLRTRSMDFDDLLHLWLEFLESDEAAGEHERTAFVVCDEVQDSNEVQNEIAKSFARHGARIVAVGDDCQSIYGFRGSNMRHIHEFMTTFEGAEQLALERNYRSTPEIAGVCDALIEFNLNRIDKRIRSMRPSGTTPALYPFESTQEEMHYLTEVCNTAVLQSTECAVLFRTNREVDVLEASLRRHRVPFSVLRGKSLVDRPHVRALIAMFRFCFSSIPPMDSVLTVLTVHKGVGNQTASRLYGELTSAGTSVAHAFANLSPNDLPRGLQPFHYMVNSILIPLRAIHAEEEGAYGAYSQQVASACTQHMLNGVVQHAFGKNARADEHPDDVRTVGQLVVQFEAFEQFLDASGLGTHTLETARSEDNNLIKIGTIHQAKGLEFETCVVAGCSDGSIPSMQVKSIEETEEERRLLYVAASRAQDQLCFTFSRFAAWDKDSSRPRPLTQFLRPIIGMLNVRQNAWLLPQPSPIPPSDVYGLLSEFSRDFGRWNAVQGQIVDVLGFQSMDAGLPVCPLAARRPPWLNSILKPGPQNTVLFSRLMLAMFKQPTLEWRDLLEAEVRRVVDGGVEQRQCTALLCGEQSDGPLARTAWPTFCDALQHTVDQLLAGQQEALTVDRALSGTLASCTLPVLLDNTLLTFKYDDTHGVRSEWAMRMLMEAVVAAEVVRPVKTIAVMNLYNGEVWRATLASCQPLHVPRTMQPEQIVCMMNSLLMNE